MFKRSIASGCDSAAKVKRAGAWAPGAWAESRSPASGLPTETPPGQETGLERCLAWRTQFYTPDDPKRAAGQMRALFVAVPGESNPEPSAYKADALTV